MTKLVNLYEIGKKLLNDVFITSFFGGNFLFQIKKCLHVFKISLRKK